MSTEESAGPEEAPALPRTTGHRIIHGDARRMTEVEDGTVHLVVTSPPYPMITMWDAQFARLEPAAGQALAEGDGLGAFEYMHALLDEVWRECRRVLVPGGLLCINIGDAVRTLAGEFRLYPNHSRILRACGELGFRPLPPILWYKPANSPTKFMGSGMLPPGAYVTLEHEYVLLLRNGPPRRFPSAGEKRRRRASALFWEERNRWFSNFWELRGIRQKMGREDARMRSGAFPFELPFRLIQMFSLIGDTVLDPFLGVGTTLRAAAVSGRNSAGYELDAGLAEAAERALVSSLEEDRERMRRRLRDHLTFIAEYRAGGKSPQHRHQVHGYPVVTGQERELRLPSTGELRRDGAGRFCLDHREIVPAEAEGLFSEGLFTEGDGSEDYSE
jgi:DNA modification methylase